MKKTTKQVAAVGAAAAATMAAAAGAYYLYGSDKAKQHRAKVAGWAKKAESEIVREAKRLKKAAYTDKNINRVIAAVSKRYQAAGDLDAQDVKRFVSSVSQKWNTTGKALVKRASVRGKIGKRAKTSKKR